MNNQSFPNLTTEQQDQVIDNVVAAVQLLYKSVKQRKLKEMVEKMEKENGYGEKYGKSTSL